MKGKNFSHGLSKILSILLSVALIFGALPVVAQAAPGTDNTYQLVSSLTNGGVYVICAKSGSTYYALKSTINNGYAGTSTSPASFTVSGDGKWITSAVDTNIQWTYSSSGNTMKNGDNYLNRTSYNSDNLQLTSSAGNYGDWRLNNGKLYVSSTSHYLVLSTSNGFNASGSSYSGSNIYLFQQVPKSVSSIAVNHAPTKTAYNEGDTFDPAGMVIRATYNDGSYEDISTSGLPDGYTFTPTGALSVSDRSVSVTYGGKSTTQAITVNAKTVASIEITESPSKIVYDEGETFDPSGMVVMAYYDNGESEPVTEYTINPPSALTPEDHSVTITYNGKTATQNITVNALVLSSIDITSQPEKTSYIEDQLFDPAGMVVTAYYTNGSHAIITNYTWSPDTKLATTDTQVTVSYKGMQDIQPITVAAKALDHIAITTAPTKTTYVAGQPFSSSGMVVKAYYTNGLDETVTDYSIDPNGSLAMGTTKVTITFTYKSVIKSAEQNITVVEKALDHIGITTPPAKTAYVVGQTFDPAGMVVTAYYNDDTNAPITGFTYSPNRTLVTTDTKVTVSFGGKSVDQTITVAVATNAATPTISPDTPDDWMAVDIGATASLSVSATVSQGTLTYQWYSNTTNLNSGGTPVGTSSSDPTLALNTATANTTFYYCVVTNTDTTATGNQTATATSRVAQVIVRRDAQTPNIVSTSPANMSVYQNSSSSITVSAYIDSGVLTYQWYSNTTGLNSGGTPVGSPSSSPTLTLNTSAAGTKYYYCVVTNTDNAAPGIKTATATSRAAKVIVSGFSKGTLLLTFDDGWTDQYTRAYPILNAAGFKGTAYVNSDFIIQHENGFMTRDQAKDLYDHGWDIANHTSTHEDVGVGDQTDQAHLEQLKAMYNDCANWLTSNDMPRAAYHVAYPSGLYSQDLIRLLKINGFKTGRATMYGQQYGIQDQNDYFTLPVYSLGDTNDLAACLDGINEAANTGTTLIIMIHKVEPYSGDLVTLTSWLQQVVDRAKTQVNANKLQVMTMTEWFEAQGVVGSGQTPPVPNVTNNDAANTVSGLNLVMEYKLDDAASYTTYDPATFASLNLAGDHTLAVRYAAAGADPAGPDKVLNFTKLLTSITITTPPAKTVYVEGTTFDQAGMVVTAHYDDGTTKAVTDYTIDKTGALATTDKKVTVSYTNAGITKTVDQPITVNEKKLSSITITTEPTKKTYVEGTSFDPAGMVVKAYYDNGTSEVITDYTTAPTGELATTDTKVTVTYTFAGVTKTVDQTITVNEKALSSIAITTPPKKTVYIEGNIFDREDMVVTAYYNNGKSEVVTGYTIAPSGELATTDTKVTVSYTYAGVVKTADQPVTVNAKKLTSIAITTEPLKKAYIEGNVFNSTGMVVTAYYDNGTNKDVFGYSIAPAGTLSTTDTKVTVSYTYKDVTKTADQEIMVHAKSLARIEITTPPSRTAYVEGNTFNTAGMVVTAYYDNDTSAVVTGYSIDPAGALATSDVRVTVSYTYVGVTKTVEQPITVTPGTLSSIVVTSEPTKKVYIEGETFDSSGMVVTAYYSNGIFETVTDYITIPSGELATSDTKVTVAYTYRGVTKTDDQSIIVNAKKLSSIDITTAPTKKVYVEGTSFDPAGMVVTAYYDNGKSETVTGYTITPSRELAATDTKVTVSYTFAGVTKTDDQTITVSEKELSSIAITTPPLKNTYIEGNTFNPAGMVVMAYFDNGKSETVTGYTIAPSGELETTDEKVTVSYNYKGVLKTVDQPITVNAKRLTNIAITTAPTNTQYVEGQSFDTTDMMVTAYYDNGKHEAVTGYTVDPSGELAMTDTKVTVSYTFAGVTKTAVQPITVALKSLNHIAVTTPPLKTAYIEGNRFDPAGMEVTAYFDNGTFAAVTGYSLDPSGALSTTDKKVTVNYGGKTAEQVITVAAKSLDHIAITSGPIKTKYVEGQTFKPDGMKVTAYYDNGTSGLADGFTWKPDTTLAIADTKVTVSFTYEGVTKTADQGITVIAKAITGLKFKTHPTKVNYVEGETFNPAGLVLTATYNDGSSKDVQPGKCTFSINRPLKTTDKSINVIYESMHVTQSITVFTKVAPSVTAESVSYSSVKLSWNAVTAASGYEIYRAASSTGTYLLVTTTASTNYTNTALTSGKTYYYKVRTYKTIDGTKLYGSFSSAKAAKPVPATPAVTAASASYSSVKVSWKAISGASGYQVYRATSSGGAYTKIYTATSGSKVSYTDTKRTSGKTYYYKVRAYRTVSGSPVYGSYSSVKAAKPVPATPAVTAASASYSSVKVSWKAISGASGYQVYRATSSGGAYTKVYTATSGSKVSYTNTGLTSGKTYYYKVRAYKTVDGTKVYGSYSSVKSAKPVPAAPTDVKAKKASSTKIKVSWGSVSGASGYAVYRATSKTGSYTKVTTTTSKSYTNTGLTSGKTYYYKVRAYRTVNGAKVYGRYSSIVSAKP